MPYAPTPTGRKAHPGLWLYLIYIDMTENPLPLAVRGRRPLSPTFFSCLATRKEGKRKSSPREGF